MSTREAGAADIGIDAASQSSKWPKQRSSYAESKPISRNFIFDTVQSISKPAVKMNATELAALRAGRDIQQAPSPSSACSTLPCSDDGGARITEPQKCSNANSSQSCVMGNEVDTAYLRSMNRDTRRGFIDLDEIISTTHDMSLSSKRGFQNDDDDEKTQLATNDIVRSTNISDNNKVCRPAKQLHGSKSLPKTKLDLLATPSPITHPAVWNQINLSFLPTAKNFLGEGRYAEVYRGSYTLSGDAGLSIGSPRSAQSSQALSSVTCAALGGRRRSSTLVSGQSPADTPFFDCAVKRLHATTEAQADLHALTVKNKLVQLLDTFPSMQVEPYKHSAKSTANQSVQSYSKPPSTASGKKKSPTAATAPNPAPQLLLVLEYLPNGNLWDWAMRHKESVGRILWMNTTTPSLARQSTPVLPGSPTSPNSQSLTNGLGRGTLAYSAPDLFNSTTAYSFPVDMYSLGSRFALISGCEPFGLARTSVHMMVGIQRGFFESGMQHSRIFSGPSQRGGGQVAKLWMTLLDLYGSL
ncbi:hypothetical protein BSLG_008196 [Batrachochytrium salamandrivorans]|nr:hypothetical protein BSLG_008196 [Batrachochytrium salamandrivorans]